MVVVISIHMGRTMDSLPSLGACIVLSGTKKAGLQEGGFQVISSPIFWVLCLISEVSTAIEYIKKPLSGKLTPSLIDGLLIHMQERTSLCISCVFLGWRMLKLVPLVIISTCLFTKKDMKISVEQPFLLMITFSNLQQNSYSFIICKVWVTKQLFIKMNSYKFSVLQPGASLQERC